MVEGPDADILAAARHGSYCPKLCTFACPVTAATGRDDAVPWSFHRAITDLADGRLEPGPAAAARLSACSGCLACRTPCDFDQDVPSQVRAGRRSLHAARAPIPGLEDAVAAVGELRSPFSGRRPDPGPDGTGEVLVLAGCREEPETLDAALGLLAACGVDAAGAVVSGCCGATLDDLGASGAAAAARERLAVQLRGHAEVLLLDPHCRPDVEATASDGVTVRYLIEELADRLEAGSLHLDGSTDTVTYHDPCLLARRDGVTAAPRRLLEATGASLVEPEHHGVDTACSGAGLALELVDPSAAAATAERRREQLASAGGSAITACSGAAGLLASGEAASTHLVRYLAEHLSSPA